MNAIRTLFRIYVGTNLQIFIRLSLVGCLLFGVGGCEHAGLRSANGIGHLTLPSTQNPSSKSQPPINPLPVNANLFSNSGAAPLTYTLAVNRVNVQDFLFALSRDAKVNIDIHPDIQGMVSLNAVDQTLTQILDRLGYQVELRHEFSEGVLRILPDTPYLVHYPVDYVNMSRQITSTISANTQISSGPSSDLRALAQSASGAGNISNTRVENTTTHHFWDSLARNIQDILRETDKMLPEGSSDTITEQNERHAGFGVRSSASSPNNNKSNHSSAHQAQNNPTSLFGSPQIQVPAAESSNSQNRETRVTKTRNFREAASVIVNPEGGLISVRATAKQHASVQEFLHKTLARAHRQVLIEATIVEVELTDGYQQGIDWSRVRESGSQSFSMTRADVGGDPSSGILPFTLRSQDKQSSLSSTVAIDLLHSFGKVKVLSSPRLAVLNNQTALLKVVENIIYFSVKADTVVTANVGPTTTVTTTPQSVSVGLVMSVTPQVSDTENIILNVRPTISSIAKYVPDPNPVIPIPNQVPQIRTREIESILSIKTGEIAVLGGLMEDRSAEKTGQLPGFSDIPLLGELFTTRNNSSRKSELVVLLRPVRIDDPERNNWTSVTNRAPSSPLVNEIDEVIWLDTQDQLSPQPNISFPLHAFESQYPQSAGIWLAQGNQHLRRKRFAQAQAAYRMAEKLAPNHPTPTANLALSLELQGDLILAQHHYLRSLNKTQETPLTLLGYLDGSSLWIKARLNQLDQMMRKGATSEASTYE
jgi:MSHA type pilus biogenesis protein MshL